MSDGQETPPEPRPEPAAPQDQLAIEPTVEAETANAEGLPTNAPSQTDAERTATNDSEQPAPLSMGWLGDGWAQWAIALFSFIALLLSAWAVRLLEGTLKATRAAVHEAESATKAAQDAVDVNRDIGRKQVRAYPGIKQVKVGTTDESLTAIFLIEVHNAGQSPAFKGLATIRVYTTEGVVFGFAAFREIGAGASQTQTVRVNTKDLTEIQTKNSSSDSTYGLFDAVFVSNDVFDDNYETQYHGIVSFGWYEDVLGIHIEPATNPREDTAQSVRENHAIERERLRRRWREMEQSASISDG